MAARVRVREGVGLGVGESKCGPRVRRMRPPSGELDTSAGGVSTQLYSKLV